MDTVVIVCKHIERADMFADLYVHLLARKDVKDLIKVTPP
jgi:poly(A) polymerase Pap1